MEKLYKGRNKLFGKHRRRNNSDLVPRVEVELRDICVCRIDRGIGSQWKGDAVCLRKSESWRGWTPRGGVLKEYWSVSLGPSCEGL